MLCEQLMKDKVECLTPGDATQTAAARMRDHHIGFMPVCDTNGKVLGTLTDRDIALRIVAEGRALDTPVADVMTQEVISCSPKDDVRRAEDLMAQHHKSRVLCIDNGRLRGVISLSDIAQREQDTARVIRTMRDVSSREAHI